MTSASFFFWFLLPLPGYVLVRRFWREDLESGLMGVIALSYFATLALLSPVSILCYVMHFPVGIFSAVIALSIAAALVEITRQKWWGLTGRLLAAGIGVEAIILVLDMALDARVGAYLAGDAWAHLARIRFILDHGFNNDDPFVAARHFYPIYHTNLVQALYAACAQLTHCEMFNAWFDSLPWAKLLVASGSYYMTWCVFGRRWAAWAAAMFVIGVRGPFAYLVYPNQLSPYYLTPMMIAFVVMACRGPCGWKEVLRVGMCALVIGQFHGLYVLFCIIALAPVLGGVAVWRLARRDGGRWRSALCTAAIFAGLPFILVSKWKTPAVNMAPVTEAASIREGGYFVRVGQRYVMRNPSDLVNTLGGGVGNSIAWVAGIGCALAARRRREAAIVLTAGVMNLITFYVPPVCTFVLKRLGEEWVMQRFDYFWGVCQIALVPGAIAYVLDFGASYGIARSMLSGWAVVLGALAAGHVSPDDWKTKYLDAITPTPPRRSYLKQLGEVREFVRQHIPSGEVVLSDPYMGVSLPAIGGYRVVYSPTGSNGVPDLSERREDLKVMLDPLTPWEKRAALLRKHHIHYFVPATTPGDWAQSFMERYWFEHALLIIKINLD